MTNSNDAVCFAAHTTPVATAGTPTQAAWKIERKRKSKPR